MARPRRTATSRSTDDYRHDAARRKNNPPVGMAAYKAKTAEPGCQLNEDASVLGLFGAQWPAVIQYRTRHRGVRIPRCERRVHHQLQALP